MTLKVNIGDIHYAFELKSKYTVIQGNSATGKSSLWKVDRDTIRTNIKCFFSEKDTIDLILMSKIEKYAVVLIDELLFNKLTDTQIGLLHKTPYYVVIICRKIPDSIPVDYREIYELKESNKYYTLVRKYPDYEEFKYADKYICEDKKSGYQYFSNRLVNVDHADGISNVADKVNNSDYKTTTAIIDGAACGAWIDMLVDMCNIYAPVSFEYLCYKKISPHSDLISNPYAHWDFAKYKSLEEMFTHELNKLTTELGYHYSKEHCPIQIKQLDLLPMQTNPKIVWSKYCKHFGIINEEAEFQRLKNLYNVSDEELFKMIEQDFL